MNVWRKRSTKYVLNGQRVPSGTPHATKTVVPSKRWYGTLRTADGRTKQVPLSEDREAAKRLLRTLQTDEDRLRAMGGQRHLRERGRPIGDLVAEY